MEFVVVAAYKSSNERRTQMKHLKHAGINEGAWAPALVVVVLLAGSTFAAAAAGMPAAAAGQVDGTASPPSVLTDDEMEQFLLNAKVLKTISFSKGVTKARRVSMSDGRMTHDAQIQDVDIEKAIFEVSPKHTEINFKDLFRYNTAAYRLSRLLGLDNVPVSVERIVDGKPAAVTWWLDDVAIEEGDRAKKKIEGDGLRRRNYWAVMNVFDELIQNRDRNGGNILWSSDWRLWMIDHTRAFRLGKSLLQPKALTVCDRALLDRLRGLTRPALAAAVGKTLTAPEIDALMSRRDLIVKLFEERVATLGEAAVLFALN